MGVKVIAVNKPDVMPLSMPERFRHEITYFMTPASEAGAPKLGEKEYWVKLSEAQMWYDDGVFRLVSPLDSQNQTEIELSEEQEEWLAWMLKHQIEVVKLV